MTRLKTLRIRLRALIIRPIAVLSCRRQGSRTCPRRRGPIHAAIVVEGRGKQRDIRRKSQEQRLPRRKNRIQLRVDAVEGLHRVAGQDNRGKSERTLFSGRCRRARPRAGRKKDALTGGRHAQVRAQIASPSSTTRGHERRRKCQAAPQSRREKANLGRGSRLRCGATS